MKGQLFYLDLIASALVFIVLIALILAANSYAFRSHSADLERKNFEIDSIKAIQNLLRTPGQPENWEAGNLSSIKVLGLSSGNNNILDSGKVDAFLSLDYITTKNLLGLGADFEIKFVGSMKSKGSAPPPGIENIIFFRRFAYYNNSVETVEAKFWRG